MTRPSPLEQTGFATFTTLLKLLVICASSLVLIKGALMMSTAQSPAGEERKFKSKEFPDMPLRVRKVKNLQSETWPNDLEIEVENVSNKPIYFINAVLEFPDDPAPNGSSGIKFKFGNPENMDTARIAQPADVHVDPGETVVLTISGIYRKGLMVRQQELPHNFKKLEFWFEIVSFGDGTGYEGSQLLDSKKPFVQPEVALPEKSSAVRFLCANSVFSVSLWLFLLRNINHRDTENTEFAQRRRLFGQSQFKL
jgi:hypothetical protein